MQSIHLKITVFFPIVCFWENGTPASDTAPPPGLAEIGLRWCMPFLATSLSPFASSDGVFFDLFLYQYAETSDLASFL